MSRWAKAAGMLEPANGGRVLDLGCAFGWGTRLIARHHDTYGHDLSEQFIARARRLVPSATFTVGDAHHVPYPDGFFDSIVLLDVLEHVPDDRAVVAEIARLLRPGGQLVLSVPNQGWLAPLDSLNVYHRLFGERKPAPTDDPSWPQVRQHRHYSLEELRIVLTPIFEIRRAECTGLGVAELVNLPLLLLFRALTNQPRVYNVLQYLYFGVYLAEDLFPTGPSGYHLMIDARRL